MSTAETNKPALHLFHKFGFEIYDAQHGSYDGGQKAIRMHRLLRDGV